MYQVLQVRIDRRGRELLGCDDVAGHQPALLAVDEALVTVHLTGREALAGIGAPAASRQSRHSNLSLKFTPPPGALGGLS